MNIYWIFLVIIIGIFLKFYFVGNMYIRWSEGIMFICFSDDLVKYFFYIKLEYFKYILWGIVWLKVVLLYLILLNNFNRF